jgi:hypothetical protein
MKLTYSLIAAALACGLASAQTTAYTTPVGYITHSITGAVGGNAAYTLLSPTLVQPVTWAGTCSAAPSGSDITASSALPGGIDVQYYVEITEGASAGWWSTVASVAGNTITVTDTFPSGIASGAKFVVKKHNTISSFLGANLPGLDPGLGLDDADEIQILDASAQAISSYFYALAADGAPVDGWYDSGGNAADNVVIVPGTSVMAVRKVEGNKTFASTGEVKTTPTQVDVFVGYNWLAPMRATGVTLVNSGLNTGNTATGVQQGIDLSVDEVQFIPESQSIAAYFAADFAQAGVEGWYDSGGASADTVLMDAPYGIQLVRKFNGAAVWTVPAITIAP